MNPAPVCVSLCTCPETVCEQSEGSSGGLRGLGGGRCVRGGSATSRRETKRGRLRRTWRAERIWMDPVQRRLRYVMGAQTEDEEEKRVLLLRTGLRTGRTLFGAF